MKRLILIGISVLSLITVFAIPAYAGNWLGHTAGYDKTVTFDQNSLNTGFHDAFHWNNNINVEPTNVKPVLYHSSPYDREVELYDAGYGDTGWAGRWYCQKAVLLYNWCEIGVVQFNFYYGPYTTQQRRHLVCHEVGHSLGLDHAQNHPSCTRTIAEYPDAYDYKFLSDHDVSHINFNYTID